MDEKANRLRQTHPEAAEQIYDLQRELNEQWNRLTTKANNRKERLLDSYDYQRFLSDFRDLMQWIAAMNQLGLFSIFIYSNKKITFRKYKI